MELSLIDRSNYLKGILILIGKDKKLSIEEKNMFKSLGKALGFGEEFCEEVMEDLLENEYLIEEPPRFEKKEIAELFFKDGLKLALSDGEIHLYELNWLNLIAEKNELDKEWRLNTYNNFKENYNGFDGNFEIEKILSHQT
ncbi:MAG: hypothetical protein ACOYVE_11040 [Melioribacter sp.]|uniref:tellurite resistance TerB family protein n=1 Tax=Melioribacter sp. TaxID=2052167 RepID=UPI003BD1AAB6